MTGSTFTTTLLATGGNNVGIEIPDAVVAELGGKRVPVRITPRTVEVPEALAVALATDPVAAEAWERLAYSHRKEHARAITEAKAETTRDRRVQKALAMLRGEV